MSKNHWRLDSSLRILDASRHYSGTVEQVQRGIQHTNVVNRQRILDVSAGYAVTEQLNVSFNVPVLLYGRWSVPLPVTSAGTRYGFQSMGLGDVAVQAKYWLLNTKHNPRQNIMVGAGVQAPTGDPHYTRPFPDITGQNIAEKPVDQSIQPGQGAWGFPVDIQAFKSIGNITLYMSGTYLINPTNINGTPSILTDLLGPNLPASREYARYNSVPDQYLVRAGVAFPIPIKQMKQFSGSLSWRLEGVPATDLIGNSDGFRRPGYAMFVEPGLDYSNGPDTWSISVPVTVSRNRIPDSHHVAGDATFADQFTLLNYSRRF